MLRAEPDPTKLKTISISDPILKTGSGSDLILKTVSGSETLLYMKYFLNKYSYG